jgi:antitoxin component YwqK of YwqJK toxin-antitoxin module
VAFKQDGFLVFHYSLFPIPYSLSPIPYPLSTIPYSLFPIPYSLFPIPYSLFPIPYPLFPIPYPLSPIPYSIPYPLFPHTMIPENAVEEILMSWASGAKKSAYYYDNGQKVGYRWWDEDGHLLMEYQIDRDKMHGAFRTWHDHGTIEHETTYCEGKEHGISTQYDRDGRSIGTYEMNFGTGVDLWYQSQGIIAEERHYRDGNRDGFERWWNSDNQTVYRESHFRQGIEHGIFRVWNRSGKLSRGFPAYFVNGQKVPKRLYLKTAEGDRSLPIYLADEDLPQRIISHL